jgi:hypothetical protein
MPPLQLVRGPFPIIHERTADAERFTPSARSTCQRSNRPLPCSGVSGGANPRKSRGTLFSGMTFAFQQLLGRPVAGSRAGVARRSAPLTWRRGHMLGMAVSAAVGRLQPYRRIFGANLSRISTASNTSRLFAPKARALGGAPQADLSPVTKWGCGRDRAASSSREKGKVLPHFNCPPLAEGRTVALLLTLFAFDRALGFGVCERLV